MTAWVRVTRARPCPVCRKSDWCLVSRDGSAAICPRVESDKRSGEAGYLHRVGGGDRPREHTRRVALPTHHKPALDFAALSERYTAVVEPDALARFATGLGVTTGSLLQLSVGFDGESWTFPMRDAGGRIIGIRRRLAAGRKLSVRGSREGLFIPSELPADERLFVTEGPTDCAALLTLDLAAIGRPSAAGGVRLLCDFARGRDVVVICDNDSAGRRGALRLLRALRLHCPTVRLVYPPPGCKDARDWLWSGATRHDILEALGRAAPMRLAVRGRLAHA